MRLHETQLPCPKDEFLSKLSVYTAERVAHKLTAGVPAPMPELEILRTIYESGGVVEIYADPESPPPVIPEPQPLTPQQKIAKMERDGIPEQKIDGGYIRGVREYMLGGAAMFNACNQIIEALEAKIREIGGPSYADFTAPRLPDILQTPGMQKVKFLDDQIKVLRAQI